MLVRVSVVTYIMVKVIGIRQKQIAFCKNEGTAHGQSRQMDSFWSLTAKTSLS